MVVIMKTKGRLLEARLITGLDTFDLPDLYISIVWAADVRSQGSVECVGSLPPGGGGESIGFAGRSLPDELEGAAPARHRDAHSVDRTGRVLGVTDGNLAGAANGETVLLPRAGRRVLI
jgi:hypothetical protein